MRIQHGKPSSPKFAPCSCIEAGPSSSSMSISDLEENVRHIAIEEQYDDYRAKDQKASETSSVNTKISTHYPLILSPTAGTWTRESRSSPDTGSSPDTVFAHARNPSPPVPALCEVGLTSPECATDLVFSDIKRPAGTSPLPCKRVLIFPRMPNMTFPAGVTPKNILPISNDEWVAVSWVPSQVDN